MHKYQRYHLLTLLSLALCNKTKTKTKTGLESKTVEGKTQQT